MFKRMSIKSLEVMLQLFNKIWFTGKIPPSWLHSIVVPVPKPNKPAHLPSSYRPVSLTCNVCTFFEKMIVCRLNWFIEHLTGPSPGFRSRRPKTKKRAENQEGEGHIFKIQYWMYAATGGPNVKWGATISNGGSGHHCPPGGDGPGIIMSFICRSRASDSAAKQLTIFSVSMTQSASPCQTNTTFCLSLLT